MGFWIFKKNKQPAPTAQAITVKKVEPSFAGVVDPDATTLPLPTKPHVPDTFFENIGMITFGLASDECQASPDAIRQIANSIRAIIARYSIDETKYRWVVRLNGHACDTPIVSEMAKKKWGTNAQLSCARANSVYDKLVNELGATSPLVQYLSPTGAGDTQPLDKTDKNKNRRVEISVTLLIYH